MAGGPIWENINGGTLHCTYIGILYITCSKRKVHILWKKSWLLVSNSEKMACL